jgi:hypothetical protein
VITVLYDPAISPLVETLALMLSISVVVVPLAIFRASHVAGSVSVHVKVPPVGFERVMGLASGGAPPCTPEKLRLAGLSRILGVGLEAPRVPTVLVVPVTTKLTETDETCDLLSLMVIRTVPI